LEERPTTLDSTAAASVSVKATVLSGELDSKALDLALRTLRAPLHSCRSDQGRTEISYRVRSIIQREGYVHSAKPWGELPPGLDQKCVHRALLRLRVPVAPEFRGGALELELVFSSNE
jgi:hypothetical protein